MRPGGGRPAEGGGEQHRTTPGPGVEQPHAATVSSITCTIMAPVPPVQGHLNPTSTRNTNIMMITASNNMELVFCSVFIIDSGCPLSLVRRLWRPLKSKNLKCLPFGEYWIYCLIKCTIKSIFTVAIMQCKLFARIPTITPRKK